MDTLSIDQLYTVFGNLQKAQETQTKTLVQIQRVINEQASGIVEHIGTLKTSINQLAKSIASQKQTKGDSTDVSAIVDPIVDSQAQQKRASEKLNKTIGDSFKSLSTSFLTKEGAQQANQKQKSEAKQDDSEFRKPTKLEKMAYKEQVAANTKLGALLKEVHDQKEAKQGSGIFKLLSPVLLLLGGFAALSYGAMKFGPTRKFLTDIKTKGIGATLSGLWSKLTDKKVVDWLRGLPLIGRFFDVYDAFKAFVKGDWKQGLKHLAFAVPFGSEIISILGGRKYGSKEAFLAPGGAKNLMDNFSLDNLWQNFKDTISDMFAPIVDVYNKIADIFDVFKTGTPEGMARGWTMLADYMPFLRPLASFMLKKQTEVFDWATSSPELKDVKDVKFGDVIKLALSKVYDGIGKFFKKVLNIFMTTGEILGAIGDLFTGDYGKQSAALNRIDEIAPGIGGSLRSVMNILNAFEESEIKDDDGLWAVATKLMKSKGKRAKAYSREATLEQEQKDTFKRTENLPEGSSERAKGAERVEILGKEALSLNQEVRLKELNEKLKQANDELKKNEEYTQRVYKTTFADALASNRLIGGDAKVGLDIQQNVNDLREEQKRLLQEKAKTKTELERLKKSQDEFNIEGNNQAQIQSPSEMQQDQLQDQQLSDETQKRYREQAVSRRKLGISNLWDSDVSEILKPVTSDSVQAPLEQAKEATQQEKPLDPNDFANALGASPVFNNFNKRFQQQDANDKAALEYLKIIAEHTGISADKPAGGISMLGGNQQPTKLAGSPFRGAFSPAQFPGNMRA